MVCRPVLVRRQAVGVQGTGYRVRRQAVGIQEAGWRQAVATGQAGAEVAGKTEAARQGWLAARMALRKQWVPRGR